MLVVRATNIIRDARALKARNQAVQEVALVQYSNSRGGVYTEGTKEFMARGVVLGVNREKVQAAMRGATESHRSMKIVGSVQGETVDYYEYRYGDLEVLGSNKIEPAIREWYTITYLDGAVVGMSVDITHFRHGQSGAYVIYE